jgi:hypothetical protein
MSAIEEFFEEFKNDITLDAGAQADFLGTAFFERYTETGSANGDFLTLEETYYEGDGIQLNGFDLDLDDGVLTLAICDLRADPEVQSLDYSQIERKFNHLKKFFRKSQEISFLNSLEITTPGYQVAHEINTKIGIINKVKFVLFSNAQLVTRKKVKENEMVDGKIYSYNVLDFGRYYEIENSKTEQEPIEVVMSEMGWPPLSCIEAVDTSDYKSYLMVIPAELLAKIYDQYGARLLEHNVRSFLQAQVKTNKGILNTLRERPEMFFAYNNGLTATASDITSKKDQNGSYSISSINNFQIVNGGQTTASLLYARDKLKCDLKKASVQLKLSIVDPEKIHDVVADISKWANTQNKVSASDFFSNHPFHMRVQEFSRRILASREGQLGSSRWFYERARGQYRDEQSKKLSPAEKKRFLTEFPKSQLFSKTDLAKYLMTFGCEPHTVSKGAQANFSIFAEKIGTDWNKDNKNINEQWYRDTIAKAIIFKELDKAVLRADWYGGYKANIVTYTIAWLVNMLKKKGGNGLDLDSVWSRQTAEGDLLSLLTEVAKEVANSILESAGNQNVTQYCKQQACWKGISELEIDIDNEKLKSCIASNYQIRQSSKAAKKTQKIDNELELEIEMLTKTKKEWEDIIIFSNASGIDTHVHKGYISQLLNGQTVNKASLIRLKELIIEITGIGFRG